MQKRGILYMPLGAPNNDRVGVDRPGNNLFGSSLVAVDANTGKYLWHFQVVHHDIWDYDTQDPPVLMDVHKDGKTIPAVLTVNKNALAFILDRVTGKPIFGVEERAGAAEPCARRRNLADPALPGQARAAVARHACRATISTRASLTIRPIARSWWTINHMVLGWTFLPPGYNEITVAPPGTQGGVNFYGGSYDPKLHLFVANVNNLFQPMHVVKKPDGSFVNNYGVVALLGPRQEASLRADTLGPAGGGECGYRRRGLSQDLGRD